MKVIFDRKTVESFCETSKNRMRYMAGVCRMYVIYIIQNLERVCSFVVTLHALDTLNEQISTNYYNIIIFFFSLSVLFLRSFFFSLSLVLLADNEDDDNNDDAVAVAIDNVAAERRNERKTYTYDIHIAGC